MGSTLTNGIYLPAEGERNCYTGLAANWSALDSLIGGYNAHIGNTTIHVTAEDKQAWNGKADASALNAHTGDATIHVTAEDKQAWNGKADNSALTAHTGNTTIHVTAEDKQAWNGKADASALTAHTGDTTIHVTAEDKNKWDAVTSKANDSDVVHNRGNETVAGDKVFNDRLIKNIDVVLGTTPSTGKYGRIEIADNNKNSLLQILGGVYDTGNSYARFCVQNKTADDGTGLSPTGTLRTCGFVINLPASSTSDGRGSITPRGNQTTDFGLVSYQWRNLWCKQLYLNGTQFDPSAFVTTDTNQTISGNKTFSSINGVEPSSLSLPSDTSIDISAYVTDLSGGSNYYVAPENGIVSVFISGTTRYVLHNNNLGIGDRLYGSNFSRAAIIPVRKNDTVIIQSDGGTLNYARFYPCQGNV